MASEGIHPARRFGQHFAGPGIWPGEITSGTYHGRLPPVTPEHLAASGGCSPIACRQSTFAIRN